MINVRHVLTLFVCTILVIGQADGVVSTLDSNDPDPVYYTHTPHDYLSVQIKRALRQPCIDQPCYDSERAADRFLFSIGAYHQKANRGRDYNKNRVFLGDIAGRWNMLSMLYGKVPMGQTLNGTELGDAKTDIFGIAPNAQVPKEAQLLDPNMRIGFFSVPIKYQKTGVRFALEFGILPCSEMGIGIYGGGTTIKQTVSTFHDLTPTELTTFHTLLEDNMPIPNPPPPYVVPQGFLDHTPTGTVVVDAIQSDLMELNEALEIFKEIGQCPCNFKKTSVEDLHVILWWRHLYRINECNDPCYASFTIMPFATIQATLPLAKKKDRRELLSIPFGNDGHLALGGLAGFAIDWHETLEIGFSGGGTYFFPRDFDNFRVPNNEFQTGIFPFSTNVKRKPGKNLRFDAYLTAHHFICLLSGWVQYSIVSHSQDRIVLTNAPDKDVFKPEVLECVTKWESHMVNTGATYDISPNIALGAVVQWPVLQRNAYRATTLLATIQVEF